jgi:hypothetical protein
VYVANRTVTVTHTGADDGDTVLGVLDRAGFPATRIAIPAAAEKPGQASCACCGG